MHKFDIGDRVQIVPPGWAVGSTGTVYNYTPELTPHEPFWVQFDTPRQDGEEDGYFYSGGAFPAKALWKIPN